MGSIRSTMPRSSSARPPLLFAVLVLVTACGGASQETSQAAPKTPAAPVAKAETAPSGPSQLRRSQVKETIHKGVGYFLQDVTLEDWPVMHQGKFHGFKIRELRGQWGVDLRPGDVVTRVNGMSIEKPEDADLALKSLEKAPALVVDYERDGKAKKLEVPIVEDAAR